MPKTKSVATEFAEDGSAATFAIFAPLVEGEDRQAVAHRLPLAFSDIAPKLVPTFALYAVSEYIRNRLNRIDEADRADKATGVIADLFASIRDGSWTPGRAAGEDEPTDLMLAVAEVTKKPVHVIQREFDERIARDNLGNPITFKRAGKTIVRKYFDASMQRKLAEDPRIKAVLARLSRERADRLAKEARGKHEETGVLDVFANLDGDEGVTADAA